MSVENPEEKSVKAVADEIIEDCKDAFGVFVNEDGFVNISVVGSIIRALGEKLTEEEEQETINEYNVTHPERSGKNGLYSIY